MRYLPGYEFSHCPVSPSVSKRRQCKQVRLIYLQSFARIMTEWKNWILFFQGLEAKTLSFSAPSAGFEKKKTNTLFLSWCSSQHAAEVWFPDTVFEFCCEVRRSKAKPAGAASFVVRAIAPVYKTLHIIPSPDYLLELKQCKSQAGQLWMWDMCLLRKKEHFGALLGKMWWNGFLFNATLTGWELPCKYGQAPWEATELKRNQYQYQDKHVKK